MYKALLVCLFVPLLHAQTPSPNDVRGAATRAVAIVQHGATGFSKIAPCFSCHNHALPIMMLNIARERGVPVDEAAAVQVVAKGILSSPDFTSIDRAVQDPMIIDPAVGDGWGLVTAHEVGVKTESHHQHHGAAAGQLAEARRSLAHRRHAAAPILKLLHRHGAGPSSHSPVPAGIHER